MADIKTDFKEWLVKQGCAEKTKNGRLGSTYEIIRRLDKICTRIYSAKDNEAWKCLAHHIYPILGFHNLCKNGEVHINQRNLEQLRDFFNSFLFCLNPYQENLRQYFNIKILNELKAKEERLLDFYLEQKVTPNLYEKQAAIIAKQIKELETNAEKYKLIDAKQKENLVKVMSTAINISDIFDKASVTKKSEILKMLLSDCKLNGKKLEYTLNKPFDMLISCPSPKNLPALIVSNLDVFDALNVCRGYKIRYLGTKIVHC